jgi:hypothetical protein
MFILQRRIYNKIWLPALLLFILLPIFFFYVFPSYKGKDISQDKTYIPEQSDGSFTANSFSSYLPYNGIYRYGINQGYYGGNWTSQNTATLSMGNPSVGVKGVGVKTLRIPLYDDFLTNYGLPSLIPDFKYNVSLGGGDFTAFVGHPHSSHQLDTTFESAKEKSKVFKNLYLPIWLDSAKTKINPENTYAKYLHDVVKTYGVYIKFWEIVNEPDFTYGPGGWLGDFDPGNRSTWFNYNPTPEDLVNLRAPIFYYTRMLRISWEVIKTLSPNSYVCTGGIAYKSFLDALLRNTDNPVNGSITAEYPLKSGAYFDVLSFHSYPMYYLKSWNNAAGKNIFSRHSDAAVNAFLMIKNGLDSLLQFYGYDGKKYPQKQFICTETGVSRIMSGNDWGSNEGQRNFMIKAQVAAQRSGIKQLYWFQLGDQPNANEQFDRMGLFYYFGGSTPYNASVSDQGIALKTTSDLLYGKSYDAQRTAALQLPSTVDGTAFKDSSGNYVYVLWAKTNTDLSEKASSVYNFPSSLIKTNNLLRQEWNFSDADTSNVVSKTGVWLTGSPAFFTETSETANQNPKVDAGRDQMLLSSANSITLNGKAYDFDGSIVQYKWTKISGPTQANILFPSQLETVVKDLPRGTHIFRLTAIDKKGAVGIDDITVTLPVIIPAKIEAETYSFMSGVQTENTQDAGGGLNVSGIDQKDWVEYSFAVPAAGRYAVNLRIATPNKDAQLQIKKAEGTILSTLNIPTTGGWQTWQTITATVPLEKGLQSLRVQASATPAWNMNWLQLQGPN